MVELNPVNVRVCKKIFKMIDPSVTPNIHTGSFIKGSRNEYDPKMKFHVIMGNPPYLGSTMQNSTQKEDLSIVFKEIKNYKNLDYISAWFIKGSEYIINYNCEFAFVSTNSICQGEQVSLLWPTILNKNQEIGFAYTSFKW